MYIRQLFKHSRLARRQFWAGLIGFGRYFDYSTSLLQGQSRSEIKLNGTENAGDHYPWINSLGKILVVLHLLKLLYLSCFGCDWGKILQTYKGTMDVYDCCLIFARFPFTEMLEPHQLFLVSNWKKKPVILCLSNKRQHSADLIKIWSVKTSSVSWQRHFKTFLMHDQLMWTWVNSPRNGVSNYQMVNATACTIEIWMHAGGCFLSA